MKKIFILIMLFFVGVPAFADRLSIKITPAEKILTTRDQLEVGDAVPFKVVHDVYKDGNLYIKKDTKILGYVDFYHENGWCADTAEISMVNFVTKDVDGNKINIVSPVKMDGNTFKKIPPKKFLVYIAHAIRGNEIKIAPEEGNFNLFFM
ncbi:MAG: hypothetical protein PHV37_10095 [Candidatus Gastranaerophilales bacterium]|nr:hypothetical protein [Candidatus Gastranaerophilales bacterium]